MDTAAKGVNGTIEVEVGKKKTKLKKFANRLDFIGFASICGELSQVNENYQKLRDDFQKGLDSKDTAPTKRIEMLDALADLQRKFTGRTLPLFNTLLADMTKRTTSGTPMGEYEMEELANAAASYLKAQGLKEEERKN